MAHRRRSRGCRCCGVRSFPLGAALFALAIAALVALLERSAPPGSIAYTGSGWLHECAKYDPDARRFLVSTFFGRGVAEVAEAGGEERTVVTDPDAVAAGMVALGIAVDRPRKRLLVVYAATPPAASAGAIAAYDLDSWDRLFFTRLTQPGDETSLMDDVAVDDGGIAYITDARGNKISKVGLKGELLSVIRNPSFVQPKSTIGLNGIAYHPDGYLLVIHTASGVLFKVNPRTEDVTIVRVAGGSLERGDGLELLSPTSLVVAGMPTRLVETTDGWATARVTGWFVGPIHRIPSAATVKDGEVFVNHIFGFGLGKKSHVIAKAVFSPIVAK